MPRKYTQRPPSETIEEKIEKLEKGHKVKLTFKEKEWLYKKRQLLIAQRKKLLKNNALSKFTPNIKQARFINSIMGGDKFISLLTTGNGFGKTALMVNIIGNIIWGAQPFSATVGSGDEYTDPNSEVNWLEEWGTPPRTWYRGGIFDNWRHPKTLYIASDPAHIDEGGAVQEEINHWFPKGRYKGEKGKYSYRSKIKTDTGWTVRLLTYEMDAKEFEAKTLGLVWCDEPPPERLWGSIISRMRRGGMILLSMTPLFSAAYLYDEVVKKVDIEDDIFVMTADIYDNCFERGTRGVLRASDIEKLIKRYPPEEREAREKGTFVSLSGKVHKSFSRDIHVIKSRHDKEKIPTRDFILANKNMFQFYQVVDPHDRKPDAVGYYALDKNQRKYVIDEYPDNSREPYYRIVDRKYSYQELIDRILLPKEKALGLRKDEITRLMDPRYAHNQSSRGGSMNRMGLSVVDEWERHYGCSFETDILDNMTACRNALDNNLLISGDGYPMLIFFEEYSQNHIYAIEHWLFDRWEGKASQKRDIKEKPQEKNSDFPRLLHYLCIYDPIFKQKSVKLIGWKQKLKESGLRKRSVSWMGR